MKSYSKVFIDLETTGLNPHTCEPITCGLVITNGDLKITHQELIEFRPEMWSEEAERIHGIPEDVARNFPHPKLGLEKIMDLIPGKSTLVCHANYNSQYGRFYFDVGLLKMLFLNFGNYYDFYSYFNKSESTHTISKLLFRTAHNKPENYRLDTLCRYYNIVLKHHDAQSDALACYKLYKKLISLNEAVLL